MTSNSTMTNNDGFNYQVPKKPFYKRPLGIILIVVGVFILLGIISSLGGGSDEDTTASDDNTSQSSEPSEKSKPEKSKPAKAKTKEPAAKPAKPEGALPIEDGDWRLDSVTVKNDGLGSFGGTARITYIGEDTDASNIFTVTVLNKDGGVVASMDGSAEGMNPDGTETVTLISSDDWKPGKYTLFDFQKAL